MLLGLKDPGLQQRGGCHDQDRCSLSRLRFFCLAAPGEKGERLVCLAQAHVVGEQNTRPSGRPRLYEPLEALFLMGLWRGADTVSNAKF
jgi:hypothetical protein